jgi:hypothetical protein
LISKKDERMVECQLNLRKKISFPPSDEIVVKTAKEIAPKLVEITF